jgi:hypothetical protein
MPFFRVVLQVEAGAGHPHGVIAAVDDFDRVGVDDSSPRPRKANRTWTSTRFFRARDHEITCHASDIVETSAA